MRGRRSEELEDGPSVVVKQTLLQEGRRAPFLSGVIGSVQGDPELERLRGDSKPPPVRKRDGHL